MSETRMPHTPKDASTPLPNDHETPKKTAKWFQTTIIRIDHLHAGQTRPYADSVYEARITITDADGVPVLWNKDVIKQKIAPIIRKFSDKPEAERGWHETYLSELVSQGDGIWRVKIIAPYLD